MRTLLMIIAGGLSAAAAAQSAGGGNPAMMAVRAGSWSYSATATGSDASFVDASGTPSVVVRCVRATRSVQISARGVPATSLSLWTDSAVRVLPAAYDPATARVTATLPAGDPLLDKMAFSRGRFAVTVPGMSPLVVPAWPEPTRAVEDCRN